MSEQDYPREFSLLSQDLRQAHDDIERLRKLNSEQYALIYKKCAEVEKTEQKVQGLEQQLSAETEARKKAEAENAELTRKLAEQQALISRYSLNTNIAPEELNKLLSEARSVPEGTSIETVKYWVGAYEKDPYNLGGGMIVKLLQEYLQLRLAASPKPEGENK